MRMFGPIWAQSPFPWRDVISNVKLQLWCHLPSNASSRVAVAAAQWHQALSACHSTLWSPTHHGHLVPVLWDDSNVPSPTTQGDAAASPDLLPLQWSLGHELPIVLSKWMAQKGRDLFPLRVAWLVLTPFKTHKLSIHYHSICLDVRSACFLKQVLTKNKLHVFFHLSHDQWAFFSVTLILREDFRKINWFTKKLV